MSGALKTRLLVAAMYDLLAGGMRKPRYALGRVNLPPPAKAANMPSANRDSEERVLTVDHGVCSGVGVSRISCARTTPGPCQSCVCDCMAWRLVCSCRIETST